MNAMIATLAFLLCMLLIAFSPAAILAARSGVELFFNTLLPTLLSFFVCATLIEKSGLLQKAARLFEPISRRMKLSCYALPLLFLSGISGYPSGPRLCGMLLEKKAIGTREAERLGVLCNLCSPMFLAGAVSSALFSNTQLFPALFLGHYGGAVVTAALMRFLFPIPHAPLPHTDQTEQIPLYRLLPKTLADGMLDLLKVGGTVIFFLVLAQMLEELGIIGFVGAPFERFFAGVPGTSPIKGILLGLFEMTGGCHLVARAGIPLLYAGPICAFLISFGGLSVMAQAMAFVPFQKPLKYIGIKLLHGCIAALLCYAVLSFRQETATVFSPFAAPIVTNALSSLSVLLGCMVGLGTACLIAALFAGKQPFDD